jgi:hypothetical protein
MPAGNAHGTAYLLADGDADVLGVEIGKNADVASDGESAAAKERVSRLVCEMSYRAAMLRSRSAARSASIGNCLASGIANWIT